MNIFYRMLFEKLDEIDQLQKIKYFAVHRVEDRDGWEYDRVSIVAEDVTGCKVEIPFSTFGSMWGKEKDQFEMNQTVAEVLMLVLLYRMCSNEDQKAEFERLKNQYVKDQEPKPLIEYGRQLAPYTGKRFINEDQCSFLGRVEPEYMW